MNDTNGQNTTISIREAVKLTNRKAFQIYFDICSPFYTCPFDGRTTILGDEGLTLEDIKK